MQVLRVATCLVLSTTAPSALCFYAAEPIWLEGRETEMNVTAGFRAVFERPEESPVLLRVTAASIYRVFVNGGPQATGFVGHGPARGPHGYARVDEWDITERMRDGLNVVAIEVAGYNCNSYYLIDQQSFVQAEVVASDVVVAATGAPSERFGGMALPYRLQKAQRFSFQRPFAEVYRLKNDCDRWRWDAAPEAFARAACAVQHAVPLLERGVPYPDFAVCEAVLSAKGSMQQRDAKGKVWKDRSLTGTGPQLKGYPEKELDCIATVELQAYATADCTSAEAAPGSAIELGALDFALLDFGINRTGFVGARVTCASPVRLFFTFDEILSDGDVDFKRMGCTNTVVWDIEEAGEYVLESIEPYTMRYLKVIAIEGACAVRNVYLREYKNPDVEEARFEASDPRLNTLFAAGVETFAQNAVDIFMDCPSRERAGWLCDSFFTARTAFDLSGDTRIEHNFLENFLLPERFDHLPKGMLPMCYPADHYNGTFIPNWALWFVVQLDDYAKRSGDTALVERLKPKVLDLFAYFEPFRNADGLLEKLESWVFVEWSEANRFVQDVNYPSNMLYAAALDVAGRLYSMEELTGQAAAIRDVIRAQSFDGSFFVDNALRKDGSLEVTRNRSEVCQYFAFFFDVASAETHPVLWQTLRDEFGPKRQDTRAYPDVHMANSFIGNMLRVELLSRHGLSRQILDESVAFLLYMAERTGTLWENVHDRASCNHGFASHICHTLYRDILGLYRVDPVGKRVHLRFMDVALEHCEGTIPGPDGPVTLSWERDVDALRYRLSVPEGYAVQIEHAEHLSVEAQ